MNNTHTSKHNVNLMVYYHDLEQQAYAKWRSNEIPHKIYDEIKYMIDAHLKSNLAYKIPATLKSSDITRYINNYNNETRKRLERKQDKIKIAEINREIARRIKSARVKANRVRKMSDKHKLYSEINAKAKKQKSDRPKIYLKKKVIGNDENGKPIYE